MKRFIVVTAIIYITSVSLFSCKKVTGEGNITEESINISWFNRLVSAIGGKTYYTQGNSFSVKIKAQRNVLDIIEIPLVNGELTIKFKNVNLGQHEQVEVFITAPDLNYLEVKGSGELVLSDPIIQDKISFIINGSGNIRTSQLMDSILKTYINESGDTIILNGNADISEVEINGSGNTNLLSFESMQADVTINGSGDVKIAVTGKLDARISGSGTIHYRGMPQVSSQISGSGQIKPI